MMPRHLTVAAPAALLALALGGSAFAADAVRPAYVPYLPMAAPAGDVALGIGTFQGGDEGVGMFSAEAKASIPVTGAWNIEAQTDAKAEFFGGVESFPLFADGYVHVWNRGMDSAWGVFGGASYNEGPEFSSVGGEFKHYLGNLTVGGAGAVSFLEDTTAWTVNGSVNFYSNPNHRIGLSAAVTDAAGEDALWEVTADAEMRFSEPASLWASVSTSHVEDEDVWTALGGFRFFLDQPGSTLQQHERDVPFAFRLPTLFEGP